MFNRQVQLVDRVLEDEGLVAGLSDEAAQVVRDWCLEQARRVEERNGSDCAAECLDDVVADARLITEVVHEISTGVAERTVLARLGRVVPNGTAALQTLASPRPLPDRLREVLAAVRQPCLH